MLGGIDLFDLLLQILRNYGLIGVFLSSFFGNVTPYFGIPYLFFIVEYSSIVETNLYSILLISLMGGLGSALGKLILILMIRPLRRVLPEHYLIEFAKFRRIFDRGLFTAIFLFAALPLPDDVLYVPIGFSQYSLIKFSLAVFLGKFIIVFISTVFGGSVNFAFSGNIILSGTVSFLLSLLVLLAILKFDWDKFSLAVGDHGWLGALRMVLRDFSSFWR